MSANSKKPDQVYPRPPLASNSMMPLQIQDPSIRGLSHDQLLNNRGIRFIHSRMLPCPNIRKLQDNDHDPLCPVCNGNGMISYCDKEIYGVFVSNSLDKNFEQQGIWDIGSAVVTFPAYYDTGEVAEFLTFDQLAIPDFPVRLWEQVEYNPNIDNGITRAQYPIQTIDAVISVQNNIRVDFVLGTDFNIVNGNIEWINAPSYDVASGRGEVFSIAYHSTPIYQVLHPMRELRITQELVRGQKIATRLPQQILVKKKFLVQSTSYES